MVTGKKFRNGQWIKETAEVAKPETIKENTDRGGMGQNASEGINANTEGGLSPKIDASMLSPENDTKHLPPESDAAKYVQSRQYLGQNATPDGDGHPEVFDNQGNNYDFSDFSFDDSAHDITPQAPSASTLPTADIISTVAEANDRVPSVPISDAVEGGNASEGINENTQGGLAPKSVTFDDLMGMFRGGNSANGNNDSVANSTSNVDTKPSGPVSGTTEDDASSVHSASSGEDTTRDDMAWENQENQTWQDFLEWSKKRDEQEAKKKNHNAWWRILTKGLLGAANIANTVKGAPAMQLDYKDREREERAYQRLKDEKTQMMNLVQRQIEQMQKDKEHKRRVNADLAKNNYQRQNLERQYRESIARIESMQNKDEREKKRVEADIEYKKNKAELDAQKVSLEAEILPYKEKVYQSQTTRNYESANKIRRDSSGGSNKDNAGRHKVAAEKLLSEAQGITNRKIKTNGRGDRRSNVGIAISHLQDFIRTYGDSNKYPDKVESVKRAKKALDEYSKNMGTNIHFNQ